ncbi:TfuA domain-containing protein [Nonomuraea sp. NPDC050404]|uniref:TfuA-like protein n=1 Tax=Nonomuraea sp. NPDC050404 TaxID=3155783 RepID=UPI0033C8C07D
MRRFLFVGPSLPDARKYSGEEDIRILPPVRAGDLPALAPRPGDVIGIIDGLFHQVRSVQHKEILFALQCGAAVLGAASMGALRAAELAAFGMRGVGRVFADFASGRLTADDEVAVVHTGREHGFKSLTFPLVSLRYTLERLVELERIPPREAERLIRDMRALHYTDRTFNRLRETPYGLECAWVDAKKDDAISLIDEMCQKRDIPRESRDVPNTIYLHAWRLGQEINGHALRIYQLFGDGYEELHTRLVRDAIKDECASRCGPDAATAFPDPILNHAHHEGFLAPDDPALPPRLHPWLTSAERSADPPLTLLRKAVTRAFRLLPDVTPDAEAGRRLRSLGLEARALEVHELATTMNLNAESRLPGFSVEAIPDDRLAQLAGNLYGVRPDELETAARMRGISGADVLIAALRPYYLLAKYNPEKVVLPLDIS